MSVTVIPVLPRGCSWGERLEPCLCAQGSDEWCDAFAAAQAGEDIPAALLAACAAAAWSGCASCGGSGVERVPAPGPCVSWSNDTSLRLFALLGWPTDGADGLVGRLRVGAARRDLAFARGRLESGARVQERPEEVGPVRAVRGDDGLAYVSPRFYSAGLDRAGMSERLDALERLLDEADAFGLAEVEWS